MIPSLLSTARFGALFTCLQLTAGGALASVAPPHSAVQAQTAAEMVSKAAKDVHPLSPPPISSAASNAHLLSAYGQLPIIFESNKGQTDASVNFTAFGSGYRLFLTHESAVILLTSKRAPGEFNSTALRIRFVGARPNSDVAGEALQEARSNYFLGSDSSRHITEVPNYARVRYTELYPGVDLVYYGNHGKLEYDFVLAPAADPAKIALAFDGAEDVTLNADGDLLLRTGLGTLTQQRPHIYQDIGGKRQKIEGRYVRRSDQTFGVEIAAYDASKPIVIDPVLSYSTFVGGSGNDYGTAVAVDAAGSAYITGYTESSNFPTAGAYQRSLGRTATNVFVTKLNSTGSGVVYSTYLGGASETDYASGIAVDSAGNAFITGNTSSSTFPTTTTAYQKGAAAGGAFVAKLGPAGNTLLYSTYVLNASANAIAVDSNGYAYIAGGAKSGFITTGGALQAVTGNTAGTNAFVLKLNTTGSAASYATFLGGSGTDVARGIAVAADGSVYAAGNAESTNFPLMNPYQDALRGKRDGFIAKLNAAGNALIYSTYLGGELNDSINAIAIDQAGSAYVVGETYSWAFPVTAFAVSSHKAGLLILNTTSQGSAFVSKLAAAGDALLYSSFLGGEYCSSYCTLYNPPPEFPSAAAYSVAVDSLGHAYVIGMSPSPRFPQVDSLITSNLQDWSNQDAMFVTKMSQDGDSALYSTFVRVGPSTSGSTPTGLPYDAGKGIAVDSSGNAYGIGEGSADFPTTTGAFGPVNAGGTDAVVFKLGGATASISLNASANPVAAGQPLQLIATVPGGGSVGTVTFRLYYGSADNPSLNTVPLVNGTATMSASTYSGGIIGVGAVYRNNGSNLADTPLLYVAVAPPAACQ